MLRWPLIICPASASPVGLMPLCLAGSPGESHLINGLSKMKQMQPLIGCSVESEVADLSGDPEVNFSRKTQ
jgi:hypothetical protein